MNEDVEGKVYYVCFYFEPEIEDKIVTYPSAISKIDYVVDTLKKKKKQVILLSIAPSKNGYFDGCTKRIDELELHVYLRSRNSKNKVLSKVLFFIHNITILLFLLRNVKRDDMIFVYHSLYNRVWLSIYRMFFPNRLVLQIEDVYSELSEKVRRFNRFEWKLFRKMKKCLCVNDILYANLSGVPQKIVSYGSYKAIPQFKTPQHDMIRLVYAGVIEQERKAAFLAVRAMRYLNIPYELHILGFGDTENILALEKLINEINREIGRKAITYHGRLSGEQYWKFLQGCDIALSTHAYTKETTSSADYTFPSKILTYLANNLRVVAQRLEVLELSSIADYIYFYEKPDPKQIAETILSIQLDSAYDSKAVIDRLDIQFTEEIGDLLRKRT